MTPLAYTLVYTQVKDADGLCQATAAATPRRGVSVTAPVMRSCTDQCAAGCCRKEVTGCQRPAAYKGFLDLRVSPMPIATQHADNPACNMEHLSAVETSRS